jgi:prepilin-type N-terminal cleavage/methylation domain-containing protein
MLGGVAHKEITQGDNAMKAHLPRLNANTQRRNQRNQQGFTLIETLVAMLIFTVGLLVIAGLGGRSFLSYANARQSTREVRRTTTNLETIRCAGYTNPFWLPAGTTRGAPGDDATQVSYTPQVDTVVAGATLITIQNPNVDNNVQPYQLVYLKPLIR